MIQRRKKQNESQRNETGRRTGAARTAQSTIVATSRLGCVCTRVNKEGERAEALLLALSASVRLRILVLQ